MAHKDVDAAVRARLAAGFSGCPVYDEGQTGAPSDASAFLVVQYPFSTSAQITAGDPENNVYRETGGIRFVLSVTRVRTSIEQGRQWAAEIATLFRGKRFDGVRTYAPTSPVTDDGNDAGSYYKLAWVVPYDFDIHG